MSTNEKDCINKARNGDRKAMGYLVNMHQQFAFNLAFRILFNEDDAKDVVQDSFIKIWKNMKLYNPKIKFTTWMYKIVTNTAIDHLRSNNKIERVNLDDFHGKLEQLASENPETNMDNKETEQLIGMISGTLSEKQKLVFALRDLQGLTSAEVTDILEISASAIKSNLYHARKMIKEKIDKILSYERSTS
ncbi:MAG: RNA polymerase sigma factor [Bacteroidetes bacterium]|nr:RNA polymerase sigma factor [Bacteroidota bacterium]